MLLSQLETFATVARVASFTRAAADLNLSQPAVTQHVAALETELGCKLFDRKGRTVSLTPAGEKLLACQRKVGGALAELRQELAGLRGGAAGRLAVGAGLTICIFTLPALLAAYRQQHPHVDLHVRSGRTQEVLRMVLEEQVDLGLVTSPVRHRLLDTVPLYRDRMLVIARPDHPLARRGAEVEPAALGACRLILFERGSGFRTYLEEVFESHGVLLRPDMELDSIEAIKEMVNAGLGISVVPEMAVARELASGTLVSLTLHGWPPMERTTSMIIRRAHGPRAPAVQAFADLVQESFTKAERWPQGE
ncbi:MAG: LysR family transcriptional regulator [Bacillota bacterium]|nr:LysR family transcriptional regulator [Bacillota bacterium]